MPRPPLLTIRSSGGNPKPWSGCPAAAEVDPAERLDCFDREIALVHAAQEANDLIIADREQVREARRSLFSFSLPKISLFSTDDAEEENAQEIDELEAVIGAAR